MSPLDFIEKRIDCFRFENTVVIIDPAFTFGWDEITFEEGELIYVHRHRGHRETMFESYSIGSEAINKLVLEDLLLENRLSNL